MAWRMRSICDRLANFPAPVVAALNGHAFGGGAEVAVAADIRLAADDIKIAFNQVALQIIPPWVVPNDSPRYSGRARRYYLQAPALCSRPLRPNASAWVDRVLPRASFDEGWRSVAKALASRPAGEIKRVIGGVSPGEAVASFARLWVADAHWQAAEKVMNRISGPAVKSVHLTDGKRDVTASLAFGRY